MSQLSSYCKRSRNPSPPSYSSKGDNVDEPSRKVRNVISEADHAALQKHYTFVPSQKKSSSWQDRMVSHYHSHLYKEYVLADLTRAPTMLGLRWRTQGEVQSGRGHETCGNKHCRGGNQTESSEAHALLSGYYQSSQPETNEQEVRLLERLPHGSGLHDYEVPFTYTEQGQTKTELVKLRLCLRCSPLIFKEGALEARRARDKQHDNGKGADEESFEQKKPCASPSNAGAESLPTKPPEQEKQTYSEDSSDSSEDRRKRRRRSKHKKRKKKHRKDSNNTS